MPVPQSTVQQKQDNTGFYLNALNESNRQKSAQSGQALGDVLDFAKTAYSIGSDVYGKVKQQEALQASGQDSELTAILTRNGTAPPDPALLRARMLINPDIAKRAADLDRYKNRGSYARDVADEVKKTDFLNQITPGGDYTRIPALVDVAKTFGDKIDSSERKVLLDLYNTWSGTDQESQNALKYAADLGGWAYLDKGEDGQPLQRQGGDDASLVTAELTPGQTGVASKEGTGSQAAQLQPETSAQPGLLGQAGQAASQAQGRMEPRGTIGSSHKPLYLTMAPGMTPEIVRQAQGTPQLQAAYAAAPANLASYWGVKPEAVQAAFTGLSETGLPADPQQRQQVMTSWAKQIQTALPGIFPTGAPPEQTVKEALALRSGAAHTALASTLKGGQPVLPTDSTGQPILYVPNTGGAVQPSIEPSAPPENKTAQTGGLTNVGFSTGIQTRQPGGQEGVALGVDEGVLRSAEMKAAQGLPLTKAETLARSNLHRVASAHVRVNGDVLVRGVPLKDLVKDYDQRLPEIENGIRKLNGMGLTVEDMMDPTLVDFQGYMSKLKPAQAAFVEKNKPIQDLLNNIISFKQDTHAQENIDLAGKSLDLQRAELAQRIKYQNAGLELEAKKLAADVAESDPSNPGAANAKAYNLAYGNYVKAFTQYRQITKGVRSQEVEKQKADPNSPVGQLWNLMTLNYKIIGNGQPMPMEPPDPAPTTGQTGGSGLPASNYSNPQTRPQSSLSGTGASTSNVDNFMSKYTTR